MYNLIPRPDVAAVQLGYIDNYCFRLVVADLFFFPTQPGRVVTLIEDDDVSWTSSYFFLCFLGGLVMHFPHNRTQALSLISIFINATYPLVFIFERPV